MSLRQKKKSHVIRVVPTSLWFELQHILKVEGACTTLKEHNAFLHDQEHAKVYLLYFDLGKSGTSCFYVGYTTSLAHRIKQHNGSIKGGARFTTNKCKEHTPFGSWKVAAVITGFETKGQAMGFEYAMKHGVQTYLKRQNSQVHVKWNKKEKENCHKQFLSLQTYVPSICGISLSSYTRKMHFLFQVLHLNVYGPHSIPLHACQTLCVHWINLSDEPKNPLYLLDLSCPWSLPEHILQSFTSL